MITVHDVLKKAPLAHGWPVFCDTHDNLYAINPDNEVLFLSSHVKTIENSRPAGYYEPNYPVHEPIEELFDHYPKYYHAG